MIFSRTKRTAKKRRIFWIAASAVAAVVITVLALNFVPGERRIESRI